MEKSEPDQVLYRNNPYSNAVATRRRHVSAEEWHLNHICDIRAEPVIDISSIKIIDISSIKRRFGGNPDTKFHVYGTISVQDSYDGDDGDEKKQCLLYHRDADGDNLQVISEHENSLTLGGPSDVISMKHPRLFIKIKEKRTGDRIVQGSVDLEHATELEQVRTLTVRDKSGEAVGSARVEYIALRFAVAAELEIRLFKGPLDVKSLRNMENKHSGFHVYGSVYAQYGNSYSGTSVHRIKLYDRSADEAEPLMFGYPIAIDRWLIAVPAYTSLIIELDLKDRATGEAIFKGKAVFETMPGIMRIRQLLPGSNSNDNINAKVSVAWSEPCVYGKNRESRTETGLEYPLFSYPPIGELRAAWPMFEIYSMFIGREKDEELSLSGTIIVNMGGTEQEAIFSATQENPCVLKPGLSKLPLRFPFKTLKLSGTDHHFHVAVDLADRGKRIIINGFDTFRPEVNGYWKHWLGRCVSTVFKGGREHGFAALQYRIFPYALTATVSVGVRFEGPSALDVELKGRLTGYYTNYEYLDHFEKKYYGIPIYEKSPQTHRFVPGADPYELKLVRSAFAVPPESNLRIEVSLRLQSQESDVCVGEIVKLAVFELGCDSVVEEVSEAPKEQESEGSRFKVAISVKWS